MAAQRLLQPLVCKTYTPDKKSSALCVKSKDIRRRGSGHPGKVGQAAAANDTWRPILRASWEAFVFQMQQYSVFPVGHLPHAAFAATPWPHAFAKARRKAALAAVLNAGSACPRHSPCGMSTCRVFAGSGCPHGLSRLRPRLRHPWNRPCKEKKSFKGAAVIYTLPVCSLRASAAVTQATLVLRSAAQASRAAYPVPQPLQHDCMPEAHDLRRHLSDHRRGGRCRQANEGGSTRPEAYAGHMNTSMAGNTPACPARPTALPPLGPAQRTASRTDALLHTAVAERPGLPTAQPAIFSEH